MNYRILYFFHSRDLAILGHTLTKEDVMALLPGNGELDGEDQRRIEDSGGSDALKASIAQAKINFEVAEMIYRARTRAGLSQSDLAALIGSKQPVIARLEDADYEGHSLSMLQRIAAVLEQRLELRFVPAKKRERVAAKRPMRRA